MPKWILCVFVFAFAFSAGAQPHWWSFESPPYYNPLIAGVREPHISAMVPAFFDRMDFMVERDELRYGWDIDVGAELPLFGRETKAAVDNVIIPGESAWGFWIPIDFHMIEDFRDESQPIVNTDYRFGLMFKYRRGIAENRWFGARAQFGHESTHLGDEFSINGQRAHRLTFERINVSWEYLDLGAMYEWHAEHEWNIRGGVTMTVPFASSYYLIGPGSVTESPRAVTESKNWWDPYLGLEVVDTRRFEIRDVKFDIYASAELRWRTVYDYHKADAADAEERQPSINLIIGVKENGDFGGIGRASPFFRVYHGVNPHGQFRNQKNFTEIGIGLRMVR